jgi:parallel beta-helix repeat protein
MGTNMLTCCMALNWRMAGHRALITVIVIAVVCTGVPLVATMPVSTQPTEVALCTTIDQSGRYVLTVDVINTASTACIQITASDVVFDGQGHTIDSNGDGRRGVYVHNDATRLTNVTIQNVTVTDWKDAGIEFESVDNGRIVNNTAIDNGEDGIELDSSDNNTVSSNNASGNGFFGITLIISTNNSVASNNVNVNGYNGIDVLYSTGNSITGNNASANGNDGIRLYGSAHSVVKDNTVNANGGNGLTAYYYSYDNIFRNITAVGNGEWAYYSRQSPQRFSDPLTLYNTITNLDLGDTTVSFESKDIALKPEGTPPMPPENRSGVDTYLNVTNTSADAFIRLNVSYTDRAIEGVRESSLRLWRFNGSWSVIPGSEVNEMENYVYANITEFEFSIVAPLGTNETVVSDTDST